MANLTGNAPVGQYGTHFLPAPAALVAVKYGSIPNVYNMQVAAMPIARILTGIKVYTMWWKNSKKKLKKAG
jgi:hypothetical protein